MSKTLVIYYGNIAKGAAGLKRVSQFVRGLRLIGEEVCIVGLGRGASDDQEKPQWMNTQEGVERGVVNVPVGSISNHAVLKGMLSLSQRIAKAAEDAVQNKGCTRVFLYGSSWLGMRHSVVAMSRMHIPTVVDLNEWWRLRPSRVAPFVDEWLFRRRCLPGISGFVGISSFWQEYARRLGKPCIVIPAMSDDPELPVSAGSDQATGFNLVYVGMLFRRDLPMTLLEGVRLAIQRGCCVKLTVVGRTDIWRESQRAVARINSDPVLRSAVEITGWVEADRLRRIYETADAFVLLRKDEWESLVCFPTRLPEYLGTGKPVITSGVGDVLTLLKHRESAWLLPPGHRHEDLAESICSLAADPAAAQRIGIQGFNVGKEKLSFRHHAIRLSHFLDSLR